MSTLCFCHFNMTSNHWCTWTNKKRNMNWLRTFCTVIWSSWGHPSIAKREVRLIRGAMPFFFLCRCVDIIWGWKVGRKTDRNPKFRWTFWVYAELFHLPMNLIHYPKWAHKVINNWHLHHALGFALPPLPAFLELVFPSSGFASSTALCLHGDLVQLMHVSFGILEF